MTRYIGIRHRRKQTREGEARPTMIALLQGDNVTQLTLEDDTAELDFVRGELPVAWRPVLSEDNVSGFVSRHCKWRRARNDEDTSTFGEGHVRVVPDSNGFPVTQVVTKVPTAYDGLQPDDAVAMVLGGSGDRFAAALSRRGEQIGATVYRIPGYALKAQRGEMKEDDDHATLAYLLESSPQLFYQLGSRDRALIRVKQAHSTFLDAMEGRIACATRIWGSLVGRVFLNEDGFYPEGDIEELYRAERANDKIFEALQAEEDRRRKHLTQDTVRSLDVWEQIFEPITGCGERLAAGIIAPIGTIMRFMVEPDLQRMEALRQRIAELERAGNLAADRDKVGERVTPATTPYQVLQMVRTWKRQNGKEAEAGLLDTAIECHRQRSRLRREAQRRTEAKVRAYCGVHVLQGGKYADVPPERQFPRRRTGGNNNWAPWARQSLYLLGEQFNRRPNSEWGQRLLANKLKLRQAHPDVVEVEVVEDGKTVTKKRYTNGHIHKMAIWKTLNQFVTHMTRRWIALEVERRQNGTPARRKKRRSKVA